MGETQALLEVVHGPAHILPFGVLLPIGQGQGDLGVFGGHAQESRQPHPKDRSGTPGQDGGRDAHDVPGAYRGCQGGGQGLEGTDRPLLRPHLVKHPEKGILHNKGELSELEGPQAEGIEGPRPKDEEDEGWSPDKIFNGL